MNSQDNDARGRRDSETPSVTGVLRGLRARGMGFEVGVVLSIAFLPLIWVSALCLLGGMPRHAAAGGALLGASFTVLREVLCLVLTVYVIYQRGDSAGHFGIDFRPRVIPLSLAVFAVSYLANTLTYASVRALEVVQAEPGTGGGNDELSQVVAALPAFLTLSYITVGVVFEEFIVRVYLMTRLRDLGWSTSGAVCVSTVLQTSYHLYQGVFVGLALFPVFLIYSLSFARYRSALGVILPHLYLNLVWWAIR